MLALENADEILQILDRFTKQKSKDIPPELEDYISYVAKTGDTVYRWPTVQYLFREKLRNVIKDFHDTTASIEGRCIRLKCYFMFNSIPYFIMKPKTIKLNRKKSCFHSLLHTIFLSSFEFRFPDLPQCPNVDQFNYESMKTLLFERFDNFQAAPFTVQRLCELLTDPKKHYSRLDKFMRALEKNILGKCKLSFSFFYSFVFSIRKCFVLTFYANIF